MIVILIPVLKITHLKAPIGGFRIKKESIWQNDQPLTKPSPTVLLSKILHYDNKQLNAYRTTLFVKTLKKKGILHIFQHLIYFNKAWKRSMYWAKKLSKNKC